MRRMVITAAVGLGLATVSVAEAQQIETYFYDVHGRLAATTKAPAVGGSVSRYSLDAADNRAERLTEAVPLRASVQELHAGQFIVTSQFIPSADGRFFLILQADGNPVLYGPSGALWHAETHNHGSMTATLQADGNLTVSSSTTVGRRSGPPGPAAHIRGTAPS